MRQRDSLVLFSTIPSSPTLVVASIGFCLKNQLCEQGFRCRSRLALLKNEWCDLRSVFPVMSIREEEIKVR